MLKDVGEYFDFHHIKNRNYHVSTSFRIIILVCFIHVIRNDN